MMARAMWKAEIKLGSVTIPVRLYAAVRDRTVHFRLLHSKDHVPVKQRMIRPSTGEVVASDNIVRGIEVERSTFVILDDADYEKLTPKPSRVIEVLRFVPRGAISHQF